MLLWEGRQSSAQQACYLPNLSRYQSIHLVERNKLELSALLKDTTGDPYGVRTHNLGIMSPELYHWALRASWVPVIASFDSSSPSNYI